MSGGSGGGGPPPVGEAIEADVLCPRCSYNLRGLIQLRCPECGLTFAREDLDVEKRWQRGLFEFRPGVASYLRTQRRMLSPSFARRLLFVPGLRLSRLAVFHLVGVAMLVASMTPVLAYGAYDVRRESLANRAAGGTLGGSTMANMTQAQAWDHFFPLPGMPQFWPKVMDEIGGAMVFAALALLAPYAGACATMLLKDSLRLAGRSKRRAAHAMFYALDPFVPAAVVMAFLATYLLYRLGVGKGVDVTGLEAAAVLGVLVAAVQACARVATFGGVLYRQWWKGGLLAFVTFGMVVLLAIFVIIAASALIALSQTI